MKPPQSNDEHEILELKNVHIIESSVSELVGRNPEMGHGTVLIGSWLGGQIPFPLTNKNKKRTVKYMYVYVYR